MMPVRAPSHQSGGLANSGGTYISPRGSVMTITDPLWSGGFNDVFGSDSYSAATPFAHEISGGINTIHGDESTGLGAGERCPPPFPGLRTLVFGIERASCPA